MKTPNQRIFAALLCSFGLALGGAACDKDRNDNNIDDRTEAEVAVENKADEVKADMAEMRDDFRTEARARLDRLDAKLAEMRTRAGEGVDQAKVDLQAQRDALAVRLDSISTQAEAGWDEFKRDVNRGFDSIEREISQTAER